MKIVPKAAVLDAVKFDPDVIPWPEGVVEQRTPTRSEYRFLSANRTLRINPGDYIADDDGYLLVIPQEEVLNKYLILADPGPKTEKPTRTQHENCL